MQRFLILFLLTTACLGAQGQQLDPNDYIYPLRELKQRLYSANFGEIRPGHFHAGVDIIKIKHDNHFLIHVRLPSSLNLLLYSIRK